MTPARWLITSIGAAVLYAISLPGCAAFKADAKIIGVDVATCARAEIAQPIAMAVQDFLQMATNTAIDYGAMGIQLATTYGKDVAACAIAQIVGDLSGGKAKMSPSTYRAYIAANYLMAHPSPWAHR